MQIFKQSSHNGLKTSGPPLDFSTVPLDKLLALAAKSQTKFGFCSLTRNFPPLAGNLPCNEILRELYEYNGNIKEKPAPLKDTA